MALADLLTPPTRHLQKCYWSVLPRVRALGKIELFSITAGLRPDEITGFDRLPSPAMRDATAKHRVVARSGHRRPARGASASRPPCLSGRHPEHELTPQRTSERSASEPSETPRLSRRPVNVESGAGPG